MSFGVTYCNGKGCLLRESCRRYREGRRIIMNCDGDTDQHRFMDNCDPETRELYAGDDGKENN